MIPSANLPSRSPARFFEPRRIELRRRLGSWRESLRLPDGRKVVMRPIEPADAPALQAGFSTIAPEDVRSRFLRPITELSSDAARELCAIDPRRQFALVIAEALPAGEALVGAVARASVHDDGVGAEFALFVARPLRAQGVGVYLLKKLVDWARRRGLATLHGDVLYDNAPMLALAERLGFARAHVVGDPGLMRVVKTLPKKPALKKKPTRKAKRP